MWSYYGSKTTIIDYYPAPMFGTIIEPFAGTARYALRYFDREIIIIDKNADVIQIWKYLQQASIGDIARLPHFLKPGSNLNDIVFDDPAERALMGFLITKGGEKSKRNKASGWVTIDRPNHINYSLNRIASNLYKIRHWTIRLGSYDEIENQKATWYIDPPYQHGGEHYPCSSKKLDFQQLGEWCKDRLGQIIVCENMKADWMKFKYLCSHHGRTGMQREAIWSNFPFIVQQSLFINEIALDD
jgi:site-specific DNA-adenine methylase